MVRSWNHLKGSSLAGRKVLYLHLPVTRAAGGTQAASKRSTGSHHQSGAQTASAAAHPAHPAVKHHKVQRGETLSSIATSYNTTVSALRHDNRNIAALRPGMVLIVRDGH